MAVDQTQAYDPALAQKQYEETLALKQQLQQLMQSGQIGRPARPEYINPLIQQGGMTTLPENLMLSSEALKKLQETANAPGLTVGGQYMMDQATKDQLGAQATARQQLAMRGGLSGGAAERMATQGASDLLMARQKARAGSELEKANIRQQLPGLELQQQTGNVQNILNQQALQNAANLARYQSEMSAWAAKEQGAATRSSGGGKK